MKTQQVSKYQAKWVGFKVTQRQGGRVVRTLKSLGFFQGGEGLGFDFIKPVWLDASSTIGELRARKITGVANVFTDAEWQIQRLVRAASHVNYAD